VKIKVEVLVEVWEITEYKDGCIYKTKYVCDEWVPMENRDKAPKGFVHASKSTSFTGPTIRRVKS
jgi:hypothetical protein